MPYKDPIKEKERSLKRREYFREYHRKYPRQYINRGESLGYKGEELSLKILVGSKRIYRPSDLEWQGKKVEVKTAKKGFNSRSKTYRWKFYLKQLRKVDLFFIICKDQTKKTQYIFLIPDIEIKVKSFSISESKLKKYSRFLLTL